MGTIELIEVYRSRRKQHEDPCAPMELKSTSSSCALAGKLNYLGHSILPQASLAASRLEQLVGNIKVKHLAEANAAL